MYFTAYKSCILAVFYLRLKLYLGYLSYEQISHTCTLHCEYRLRGSKVRRKLLIIKVVRMTASCSATGNSTHTEMGPE